MSVDYVIQHAAPTLAGIKTGNLFPCFFSSPQAMVRDLRAINQVLVPRGLRLLPLRRDNTRVLLYLFRPAALSRDLSRGEARRLLRQAGYQDLAQHACLRELKRRLQAGGTFPHEIGLFLGYPPEDVAGFMTHQGKHCKCVGCWKVYGDEAAAHQTAPITIPRSCRNRQGSAGSCSFFVSRLTFEERFPKMIVLIFSAAFFNPIRAEFEKGGNDFA